MDLFLCNNLSAESLLISSLRGDLLLCGDLLLELSLARLCDFVFLWNRIKVVIVRFCDSRIVAIYFIVGLYGIAGILFAILC